jgi:hypothetical protein
VMIWLLFPAHGESIPEDVINAYLDHWNDVSSANFPQRHSVSSAYISKRGHWHTFFEKSHL